MKSSLRIGHQRVFDGGQWYAEHKLIQQALQQAEEIAARKL
jgi:hypothetical protein